MQGIQNSQTKRITGTGGEVNYLVQVLEVYKGGLFLKRIGKNAIHVYSGLGFEQGTECGVSLEVNTGAEYIFAGSARTGTSPNMTAHVNVNQCSLVKQLDELTEDEKLWLVMSNLHFLFS